MAMLVWFRGMIEACVFTAGRTMPAPSVHQPLGLYQKGGATAIDVCTALFAYGRELYGLPTTMSLEEMTVATLSEAQLFALFPDATAYIESRYATLARHPELEAFMRKLEQNRASNAGQISQAAIMLCIERLLFKHFPQCCRFPAMTTSAFTDTFIASGVVKECLIILGVMSSLSTVHARKARLIQSWWKRTAAALRPSRRIAFMMMADNFLMGKYGRKRGGGASGRKSQDTKGHVITNVAARPFELEPDLRQLTLTGLRATHSELLVPEVKNILGALSSSSTYMEEHGIVHDGDISGHFESLRANYEREVPADQRHSGKGALRGPDDRRDADVVTCGAVDVATSDAADIVLVMLYVLLALGRSENGSSEPVAELFAYCVDAEEYAKLLAALEMDSLMHPDAPIFASLWLMIEIWHGLKNSYSKVVLGPLLFWLIWAPYCFARKGDKAMESTIKMEFGEFSDHVMMATLALEAYMEQKESIDAAIAASPATAGSPDVLMLKTAAEHFLPVLTGYLFTWRYCGPDAALYALTEKIRVSYMLNNTIYFKYELHLLSDLLRLKRDEPEVYRFYKNQFAGLMGKPIEDLNAYLARTATKTGRCVDAANDALACYQMYEHASEMFKEWAGIKAPADRPGGTWSTEKLPSLLEYKPAMKLRWQQLFVAALDPAARCEPILGEEGAIVAYKTNAFRSCLDSRGRKDKKVPEFLEWTTKEFLIASVPEAAVEAAADYFERNKYSILGPEILFSAYTYDARCKSDRGYAELITVPMADVGDSSEGASSELPRRGGSAARADLVPWTKPDERLLRAKENQYVIIDQGAWSGKERYPVYNILHLKKTKKGSWKMDVVSPYGTGPNEQSVGRSIIAPGGKLDLYQASEEDFMRHYEAVYHEAACHGI